MEDLQRAIALRKAQQYEASNNLLVQLAAQYEHDATIQYQCAWSFDVLGEETKAVPYYEKSIALGLTGEELHGAYVGLGSTYRTIGDYMNVQRVFEAGLRAFPNSYALHTFYAMVLYNMGAHPKAMELLLHVVAKTSNDEHVRAYERAILFYSDKLDETWT